MHQQQSKPFLFSYIHRQLAARGLLLTKLHQIRSLHSLACMFRQDVQLYGQIKRSQYWQGIAFNHQSKFYSYIVISNIILGCAPSHRFHFPTGSPARGHAWSTTSSLSLQITSYHIAICQIYQWSCMVIPNLMYSPLVSFTQLQL